MENTKYKFVETTGCTAFNFTVNDKQISELSEQEYNEMLDYLFLKVKEGISNQTTLLEDVVKLFQPDDWSYDHRACEQCGDTVDTITWEI
jgi:hypothetical protein